jgi:hypothetical protein
MMKHALILLVMAAACLGLLGQSGGDCKWCRRTVAVKAYSYTEPEFTSAMAAEWLSGILKDECTDLVPLEAAFEPEYVLAIRFEKSQDGRFPKLFEPNNYDKPIFVGGDSGVIRSYMGAALFFVGGDPKPSGKSFGITIPVEYYGHYTGHLFLVRDNGMSLETVKTRIEPAFRALAPFKDVLRNYEQTPVKCTVNPSKKTVEPGEEIEVKVTGFTDYKGRKPEINIVNRILARAEIGEILNLDCNSSSADPKLKVWAYDLGTRDKITIKYKVPDKNCQDDVIKVWNSCEVKWDPPVPFSETKYRDEIGRATVKTSCYRWDLTVTSSSEKRYRYDYHKQNNVQGGQTIRHTDDEVISAKVTLPLVLDRVLDVPNEGQRWEYYHATSRDLSYFSATSNSERYNLSDYGDTGAETTHTVHKTPSDAKIDSPFLNDAVILVFDRKSGKALKATFPLYKITYTWNVEDMLQTVQWSPGKGRKVDRKENPRKDSENYVMRAVEDKIEDPTVTLGGTRAYVEELFRKRGLKPPADIPIKEEKTKVSKVNPDFLVKGGDGKTSFSGEGRKTTFTPEPNGSRREEKILRWELKRSKK